MIKAKAKFSNYIVHIKEKVVSDIFNLYNNSTINGLINIHNTLIYIQRAPVDKK